jgi:hypothetical protein
MKKLVNLIKKLQPRPRTYYYHEQVLTDELEREWTRAHMGSMGSGFKVRRR